MAKDTDKPTDNAPPPKPPYAGVKFGIADVTYENGVKTEVIRYVDCEGNPVE